MSNRKELILFLLIRWYIFSDKVVKCILNNKSVPFTYNIVHLYNKLVFFPDGTFSENFTYYAKVIHFSAINWH